MLVEHVLLPQYSLSPFRNCNTPVCPHVHCHTGHSWHMSAWQHDTVKQPPNLTSWLPSRRKLQLTAPRSTDAPQKTVLTLGTSFPKGNRRWISSGSLVEQNSVPAILTKKLDCHAVSFWSKLNKPWSDFQTHWLPFPFLEMKLLRLPYLTIVYNV